MNSPTLLLVHGAWGGAWCWRDLRDLASERGFDSIGVDLPSSRLHAGSTTGLEQDAAEVARVASTITGPVILVAHSYGGAVVLEAAAAIRDIERIVFIAALVPRQGQSATDVSREVRLRTRLDNAILVEGDHLRLDLDLAPGALYNHLESATATWATAQLSTQTIASFRSARQSEDTNSKRRYIRCSDDHAVDPSLQELMAMRCEETRELSSDHSPFLSHPRELLDAICE